MSRPGKPSAEAGGAVYRTVAAPLRHEGEKVRGSRFIVTVAPIRSAAEAAERIAELRREFPAANHHCSAYRLGPRGDVFRASDDGEPSGSAGRPILRQIDGRELTDTLVAVSRIFGGTKLGVGGLARAYGGAAAEALDHAEIVEVRPVRRVTIVFPYELSGTISGLLAAAGLAPIDPRYGASVVMGLEIPEVEADAFLDRLRERTAGRALVRPQPAEGST